MNIIKLNAIDSTNSYIKKLASEKELESYTVVQAEKQLLGRGQMGTVWESEVGENLTVSILINFNELKIEDQFYLSMAVSLGILQAINKVVKVPLMVKWPNDILADKDKVAGILIENVLRGSFIKQSVIGLGLNVNQKEFSKNIGKATSLSNLIGDYVNRDILLIEIINSIKFFVEILNHRDFKSLKDLYMKALYKFEKPAMFEDLNGLIFLGKIIDVDENGRLVIEIENEKIRKFSLKEIKFAN